MKYINRDLKGTFGYIRKQLIFEIVKTLILFAMAVGIFLIGYLTLHTRKSLWSVFAVLALLPACKSCVGVIMLARFRSLSDEDYGIYRGFIGDIPAIYENIITTSDKTYFVPAICVANKDVLAFCPDRAGNRKLKEHIDNVLEKGGHNATVKIFDDKEAFGKRCAQIREKTTGRNDPASAGILKTLKAVSL